MRRVARVLLVPVLSLACRGADAPALGAPPVAELAHRAFVFADGAAFATDLAGRPVELTFGRLGPDGGPFQLVASGIRGTDGLPARVEGAFAPPARLELATTTLDAAAFPTFVAGLDLAAGGIAWEARRRALVVGGQISVAAFPRPNIVLVLTDDQRWDTLDFMPLLLDRLAGRGTTFENAYVTTLVCSPARACFLSGGFPAQDTGVLTNGAPNGGFEPFRDRSTLATALQRAGYRTGFVGKYLNGYPGHAPYVPPGWTRFVGDRSTTDWFRFSVARAAARTSRRRV